MTPTFFRISHLGLLVAVHPGEVKYYVGVKNTAEKRLGTKISRYSPQEGVNNCLQHIPKDSMRDELGAYDF